MRGNSQWDALFAAPTLEETLVTIGSCLVVAVLAMWANYRFYWRKRG